MNRAKDKVNSQSQRMRLKNSSTAKQRRTKQVALGMVEKVGFGGLSQVARQLDIPRTTLQSWVYNEKPDVVPLGAHPKDFTDAEKMAQIDSITKKLLDHLEAKVDNGGDWLDSVTMPQLTTAIGTLIDKKRVLETKGLLAEGGTISIEQLNVLIQNHEQKQLPSSPSPIDVSFTITPDLEKISEARSE